MTTAPWQTGSPAYTAVSARRTLIRPAPAPVAEAPKPKEALKIEWPQPVREYVSRAFVTDKSASDIDHASIAAKLKLVITQAAENGQLDKIDWPNHPLPQDMIRAERAAVTMSTSKKRKSTDLDHAFDQSSPIPPWRQNNPSQNTSSIADRITSLSVRPAATPDKRQKKVDQFRATAPPSKLSDLEKRRQRFALANSGPASPYVSTSRDESPLPDNGPVIGTCQDLEKNFFRLTAPPKAEVVRPLHILKQTLDYLITKWKDDHNYGYICNQFKSLRQDLTVQHIRNDFTVRVYEAHARIALEKGDLGEYNQCQTQLRALYKKKLSGCPGEFLAYRILYTIYTCNRQSMNDVLADLTSADKQFPAVKHALSVRAALASGDYHKFFRLFNDSPNMGAYLMDMFIDRERIAAMAAICRTYRPDLKVEFLTQELAFVDDQQCAQFICDHGAQHFLESRDDGVRFISSKASPVFDLAKRAAFGNVDIKGQI